MKKKLVASLFTTAEVARFFNRDPEWIRWKEAESAFEYADGKQLPLRYRKGVLGNVGDRRYSLEDVRCMAKSLDKQGKFSHEKIEMVLQILDLIERIRE